MPNHVVVKRTFRIDGKDYGSLDEVPADKRDAVAKAIASIPATLPEHPAGKLTVNGHEYASSEELPATLRGLVESALSSAANVRIPEAHPDEEPSAEPVIPLRTIILGAGVIVLLALVARLMF